MPAMRYMTMVLMHVLYLCNRVLFRIMIKLAWGEGGKNNVDLYIVITGHSQNGP